MASNRLIYIRYGDNQPVKVETHYVGEQERRRPLLDVADLIGAIQSLPGSPLATVFAGDITLHEVVDGDALPPDSPLSAITKGITATTALIIKSKNHQESPAVITANDELLSTFWNALSKVEPNGNKILLLPTAPFLPESISGLYVRDSYEKMYQIMNTKLPRIHRFAITGTPGIGKSMFLFYLMWLLSKTDSISAVILRRFKDDGKIFVFKKDVCFWTLQYQDIVNTLDDKSTWYLTDALSPPPAEVRAVTVVVASPAKRHYNDFLKYPPAIELNYLPTWTLDELYQCAAGLFPDIERPSIEERYLLIGGIPRFVLESPQNLKRRIAAGLGKLAIEKFNQIADGSLEREDELSHFIIHFDVGEDLETYSLEFASRFELS